MSDAFTTRVLNIATGSRETVVDLTGDCEAFLREAAAGRDGLLNVFVPHATAGIAIIETGAGSDDDLLAALHALLPADDRWQHRHGSPGHGRDHVLPALVPPHATLPVSRRAAGAGHLAVGVPGGHEQGQPRPPGAAELPGLTPGRAGQRPSPARCRPLPAASTGAARRGRACLRPGVSSGTGSHGPRPAALAPHAGSARHPARGDDVHAHRCPPDYRPPAPPGPSQARTTVTGQSA